MQPAVRDQLAGRVLDAFGLSSASRQAHFLANHGGFSGAWLWRVEFVGHSYCLKAFTERESDVDRLGWIHGLVQRARAAGLTVVPEVICTPRGGSVVVQQGRCWELTGWQLGEADFERRPTRMRIESAARALAMLHRSWDVQRTLPGPCPGIARRLAVAEQWMALDRQGWRPKPEAGDLIAPLVEPLYQVTNRLVPEVPPMLAPFRGEVLPLQPCVCDLWHDHVLFQGEAVSGLIDFASAKMDHVAVDLARMLGSLSPTREWWPFALDAYLAEKPLADLEQAMIAPLEVSGAILAAANWLRWLYHEGRSFANRAAVSHRLTALLARLASMV